MYSDSSDDENLELLREAQDKVFLSDSLYNGQKEHLKSTIETPQTELTPSLRKSKDEDEQYNLFRVTPEFQKYVAKHLTQILDKHLQKISTSNISNDQSLKNHKVGGVKLFRNSKKFIKLTQELSVLPPQKNYRNPVQLRKQFDDKSVDKETLKNLAVSGENILQKKDLKYWSKRTKGKVFNYKKNDTGQFMLVE